MRLSKPTSINGHLSAGIVWNLCFLHEDGAPDMASVPGSHSETKGDGHAHQSHRIDPGAQVRPLPCFPYSLTTTVFSLLNFSVRHMPLALISMMNKTFTVSSINFRLARIEKEIKFLMVYYLVCNIAHYQGSKKVSVALRFCDHF